MWLKSLHEMSNVKGFFPRNTATWPASQLASWDKHSSLHRSMWYSYGSKSQSKHEENPWVCLLVGTMEHVNYSFSEPYLLTIYNIFTLTWSWLQTMLKWVTAGWKQRLKPPKLWTRKYWFASAGIIQHDTVDIKQINILQDLKKVSKVQETSIIPRNHTNKQTNDQEALLSQQLAVGLDHSQSQTGAGWSSQTWWPWYGRARAVSTGRDSLCSLALSVVVFSSHCIRFRMVGHHHTSLSKILSLSA